MKADEENLSPGLGDKLAEKLVSCLMSKSQIEEIEDDRYLHVMSRSQSRFAAPVGPNETLCMEFHPSGGFLAYSRVDGSLTVWVLSGSSFARSKKIYLPDAIGVDKMVYSLSWNANEIGQFATVGNSSEIFIWGIDEKKACLNKLRTLSVGPKFKLFKCLYDPNGNWLLTVSKSEELHLFNVKKDHELHSVLDTRQILSNDSVYSLCWNNSGSHVFLGFKSGKMMVLELEACEGFKVVMILSSHRASLTSIKMDPWGRYVITGSADGSCALWELRTLRCELCIDEYDRAVSQVEIDHLGKILAISTIDETLRLFDVNTGNLILELKSKHPNSNIPLKFKPDTSEFILSGRQDTLERHFAPSRFDDPSLLKLEPEKPHVVRSKSIHNNKADIDITNNSRRSGKRERVPEKAVNGSKRERVSQKTSRFMEKRQ